MLMVFWGGAAPCEGDTKKKTTPRAMGRCSSHHRFPQVAPLKLAEKKPFLDVPGRKLGSMVRIEGL